jgi:hypothetical protein
MRKVAVLHVPVGSTSHIITPHPYQNSSLDLITYVYHYLQKPY